MKKLFTILAIVSGTQAMAQSTLIEYDYQTETYTFYKINKKGDTTKLKKPFAYKGIPTKVVVKNLNTFYYDVAFKAEHFQNKPIGGEESVEVLAENFTAGFSAFNDLVGEAQSSDIYNSLFVDGQFQGISGLKNIFGMSESEFMTEMKSLENKSQQLEMTQMKMVGASNDLKKTFDKLLLAEFVDDQLIKLQLNRDISPEEMQKRARALIEKILIDDVSLDEVVQKSERRASDLSSGYSRYSSAFKMYKSQHEDLLTEIKGLEERMGGDNFGGILKNFETELKIDYDEIFNNMDALETLMGEYNLGKVRGDYLSAFENYDRIMHADFDFEYSVNTDLDVTTLTMEFLESRASDTSTVSEVIRTRSLDIPTSGGLRINSSAGMTFLRYINGHSTYSSEGGAIREVEGDAVIPSLTTMFHFYKQTPRSVSLGGTFGVGVPIDGNKDFIYLLGGSLIVGKTQRVIFNFGAFGGKIERLDGMKVGDSINDGSIVPTKKLFDFGAFMGLTLNINKLF